LRKTLKLFWEYFRLTYVQRWTALYLSFIGLWDLLDTAMPKEVWDVPNITSRVFWWFALPLLFFAPFPVFVELKKQIGHLGQQLREQATFNRQTALAADFDVRFGPSSNLTSDRRWERACAYFEKLEAEISTGDFSRAGEMLVLKDVMLFVIQGYFAGGAGGPIWHERLFNLVDTISRHQAETLNQANKGV
jgi:hypothetical protein